jgi:hypothetical protein
MSKRIATKSFLCVVIISVVSLCTTVDNVGRNGLNGSLNDSGDFRLGSALKRLPGADVIFHSNKVDGEFLSYGLTSFVSGEITFIAETSPGKYPVESASSITVVGYKDKPISQNRIFVVQSVEEWHFTDLAKKSYNSTKYRGREILQGLQREAEYSGREILQSAPGYRKVEDSAMMITGKQLYVGHLDLIKDVVDLLDGKIQSAYDENEHLREISRKFMTHPETVVFATPKGNATSGISIDLKNNTSYLFTLDDSEAKAASYFADQKNLKAVVKIIEDAGYLVGTPLLDGRYVMIPTGNAKTQRPYGLHYKDLSILPFRP